MKELQLIQQSLAVPKGQYNDYNKFKYRSLEDILEAVKPLLAEHECQLVVTDEMVNIGDRYYVKAIATLTNKAGDTVVGTGYAREAENQKGMDSAQVSGSTSSYARKYSCNGLFLIDDNADPDSNAFQKLKEKNGDSKKKVEPVEETIKSELGGRDMTAEADSCKNEAELAVWWGNLASEYKKAGSPIIAIKDARKVAIKVEQAEAKENESKSAGEIAHDQVKASKEVKENKIDYSFESLKGKTVAVLKQIAKEFEITGFSKMDKPTLITSIIKKWESAGK
jgi:hypothetical protein